MNIKMHFGFVWRGIIWFRSSEAQNWSLFNCCCYTRRKLREMNVTSWECFDLGKITNYWLVIFSNLLETWIFSPKILPCSTCQLDGPPTTCTPSQRIICVWHQICLGTVTRMLHLPLLKQCDKLQVDKICTIKCL